MRLWLRNTCWNWQREFNNLVVKLLLLYCYCTIIITVTFCCTLSYSLLSLAFATRWNPKHPSYVSIWLFCDSFSILCPWEHSNQDADSSFISFMLLFLKLTHIYFRIIIPFSKEVIKLKKVVLVLTYALQIKNENLNLNRKSNL